VLITGATGLIGSWVIAHWPAEAPQVITVSRTDVDLRAPGAAAAVVADVRPAAVLHLAWSASGQADYRSSDDNDRWLAASLELVAACREHEVALWLTGTVVDDSIDAADAYARAKSQLRARTAEAVAAGTVGWLRPAYVFDEERGRPQLVQQARAAAVSGATLTLRSPEAAHDFVHAEDVGRAVALAVTEACTGYLPVGSGRLRRVADLVDRLGARWEAPTTTGPEERHSGRADDITWLTDRGWAPTRTKEFFADD
jgi:nucleoside-diphosphate-sugar epimerase